MTGVADPGQLSKPPLDALADPGRWLDRVAICGEARKTLDDSLEQAYVVGGVARGARALTQRAVDAVGTGVHRPPPTTEISQRKPSPAANDAKCSTLVLKECDLFTSGTRSEAPIYRKLPAAKGTSQSTSILKDAA